MNIRRTIFLSVFGIYQLCFFLFTVYMETRKDDFNFLLDMFKRISLFKWGALIGVVFLVVEVIWTRYDSKKISNS